MKTDKRKRILKRINKFIFTITLLALIMPVFSPNPAFAAKLKTLKKHI